MYLSARIKCYLKRAFGAEIELLELFKFKRQPTTWQNKNIQSACAPKKKNPPSSLVENPTFNSSAENEAADVFYAVFILLEL